MLSHLAEGLRISVEALGGLQVVGHRLWPEMHPILAGQRLGHCLQGTGKRREKLSLAQIDWIFLEAFAAGKHDGAERFMQGINYRITAKIDPREEVADLTRRAVAAAHESAELSNKALALAHAMHLKVDG